MFSNTRDNSYQIILNQVGKPHDWTLVNQSVLQARTILYRTQEIIFYETEVFFSSVPPRPTKIIILVHIPSIGYWILHFFFIFLNFLLFFIYFLFRFLSVRYHEFISRVALNIQLASMHNLYLTKTLSILSEWLNGKSWMILVLVFDRIYS